MWPAQKGIQGPLLIRKALPLLDWRIASRRGSPLKRTWLVRLSFADANPILRPPLSHRLIACLSNSRGRRLFPGCCCWRRLATVRNKQFADNCQQIQFCMTHFLCLHVLILSLYLSLHYVYIRINNTTNKFVQQAMGWRRREKVEEEEDVQHITKSGHERRNGSERMEKNNG